MRAMRGFAFVALGRAPSTRADEGPSPAAPTPAAGPVLGSTTRACSTVSGRSRERTCGPRSHRREASAVAAPLPHPRASLDGIDGRDVPGAFLATSRPGCFALEIDDVSFAP